MTLRERDRRGWDDEEWEDDEYEDDNWDERDKVFDELCVNLDRIRVLEDEMTDFIEGRLKQSPLARLANAKRRPWKKKKKKGMGKGEAEFVRKNKGREFDHYGGGQRDVLIGLRQQGQIKKEKVSGRRKKKRRRSGGREGRNAMRQRLNYGGRYEWDDGDERDKVFYELCVNLDRIQMLEDEMTDLVEALKQSPLARLANVGGKRMSKGDMRQLDKEYQDRTDKEIRASLRKGKGGVSSDLPSSGAVSPGTSIGSVNYGVKSSGGGVISGGRLEIKSKNTARKRAERRKRAESAKRREDAKRREALWVSHPDDVSSGRGGSKRSRKKKDKKKRGKMLPSALDIERGLSKKTRIRKARERAQRRAQRDVRWGL